MSIGQDPDKMSERELRREVKRLRHDINTGVCRFDCRGVLNTENKKLREAVLMGLQIHDEYLSQIGNCVSQDYARLNNFPLLAGELGVKLK